MDPTRVKNLIVHKVDGPYKGKLLDRSTKWIDPTRVENFDSPQSGRTQQGLITYLVHKVDGPY